METKMLAPHPASGTHHRGYSPLGQEKASQHIYDAAALAEHRSKAPDVKETFDCGREDDPAMPNIWLSEDVLPGFRQACLEYFWTCFEIEKTLLRALALGFGLEEEYFLPFHTAPDNQLRLLHYPNVSFEDLRANKIIRVDGHTDFGSMTIMAQDDIGGLEVEHPSQPGNFVPVPPVPCSLVVNAGDFMMRWSNDTIKSTMHRVRAPLNFVGERVPDRYSIPYDFSTVVDCIPGTWSENRPKLYEPISAGGYVLKRLAAIY
ncbi:hypothetical protein AX16_004886 [Volvariella volvacea WC 439]|nr:hypothetical protein AX16_004886 [Volvariella volvacea WC 439]